MLKLWKHLRRPFGPLAVTPQRDDESLQQQPARSGQTVRLPVAVLTAAAGFVERDPDDDTPQIVQQIGVEGDRDRVKVFASNNRAGILVELEERRPGTYPGEVQVETPPPLHAPPVSAGLKAINADRDESCLLFLNLDLHLLIEVLTSIAELVEPNLGGLHVIEVEVGLSTESIVIRHIKPGFYVTAFVMPLG